MRDLVDNIIEFGALRIDLLGRMFFGMILLHYALNWTLWTALDPQRRKGFPTVPIWPREHARYFSIVFGSEGAELRGAARLTLILVRTVTLIMVGSLVAGFAAVLWVEWPRISAGGGGAPA